MNQGTVVVIEDDADVRNLVVAVLRQSGFEVVAAATGLEGVETVREKEPVVVTLDLGLPDIDGHEVLRRIRQFSDCYVIMLTGRDDEADTLTALHAGADDYLTKPFHLAELNARIQSLLRRKRFNGSNEIVLDDIRVNTTTSQVWVKGEEAILTKKEYELLLYFIANRNRILNKESIAEHLWGDNIDMADSFDFIYTHIKNLRKKVLTKGSRNQIRSLYGMGYKFVTE